MSDDEWQEEGCARHDLRELDVVWRSDLLSHGTMCRASKHEPLERADGARRSEVVLEVTQGKPVQVFFPAPRGYRDSPWIVGNLPKQTGCQAACLWKDGDIL
jgi:hypothetical protein